MENIHLLSDVEAVIRQDILFQKKLAEVGQEDTANKYLSGVVKRKQFAITRRLDVSDFGYGQGTILDGSETYGKGECSLKNATLSSGENFIGSRLRIAFAELVKDKALTELDFSNKINPRLNIFNNSELTISQSGIEIFRRPVKEFLRGSDEGSLYLDLDSLLFLQEKETIQATLEMPKGSSEIANVALEFEILGHLYK